MTNSTHETHSYPVEPTSCTLSVTLTENYTLSILRKITFWLSDNTTYEATELTDYALQQVSEQKLIQLRASGIPGFVLKDYGSYYYTPIPKDLYININNNFGNHRCSNNKTLCAYFSASSDGCPKVRDLSYSRKRGITPQSVIDKLIEKSKRIEKYSFICKGIETFNTEQHDSFIVLVCDNYHK